MPQPQQTAAMFYGKAPDEASRSGIPPAIIESFAAVHVKRQRVGPLPRGDTGMRRYRQRPGGGELEIWK